MVSRAKKAIAVTAAVIGIAVVVAAGFAYSYTPALQEQWYLWKLESEYEGERKQAAEKLGAMQSARAVPRLVTILREAVAREPGLWVDVDVYPSRFLSVSSSPTRPLHYSAQALEKIGPAAVRGLIEALSSGDARVRVVVGTLLRTTGPVTGAEVPALVELLSHESADVRKQAVKTLGEAGRIASAAVPALIRALDDEDEAVSELARRALPAIGSASGHGVPLVIDVLEDRTRGVVAREYAAGALVDERALPALKRVVADPREDPVVRRAAVWSLGKLSERTEATARALAVALGAEDRNLRFAAARALHHLGPAAKVAAPQLRRALEDEGHFIRRLAALTLESLGEDAEPAPRGQSKSDISPKFAR